MVFWIPSLLRPRKKSGEGFWSRFSVVDFTLRMVWKKRERELKGEIMRTDVFVQVFSKTREEGLMEEDLDRAFRMFRDFESRFSRFREGNELSDLNRSSVCRVSGDLFEILSLCRKYYEETGGVFDPAVLPILEQEGYRASFGTEHFGIPSKEKIVRRYDFSDLQMDRATLTVSKPIGCRIDLGGIGKGYAVGRVSQMLAESYRDFIVDAGGDIYVAGRNRMTRFPYFAIDIENAFRKDESAGLLLLSGQAVATSGVNRRRWQRDGQEKSHLIDVEKGGSVSGDILTVTVVDPSPVRADIMAKTLCILGRKKGMLLAQKNRLPALFLLKDGTMEVNEFMKPYVWEDDAFFL